LISATNKPSCLELILLIFTLFTSFYIFKFPISHIPIAFYDDGEMLYHAYNISKGGVPYLDDHSHHFLGYVIPFLAWGKIFGYTPELIRHYSFFSQIVTSLIIFLIARRFTSFVWSFVAAILYISAREPFVCGFPIQYEINSLIVLIYFSILKLLENKNNFWLYIAFLISGIGFSFDQRALLLVTIPILTLSLQSIPSSQKFLTFLKGGLAFLIIPSFLLFYLWQNGAMQSFIEQTIYFPSQLRIGSFSYWTIFLSAINLHHFLFDSSIWLTCIGFLGYISILLGKEELPFLNPIFRKVLILSPFLLFIMAGMGSRDYDYYTVVWLPLLAILSIFSVIILQKRSWRYQAMLFLILLSAILPSYFNSVGLSHSKEIKEQGSDGIDEVSEYLIQNLSPQDSVYIWGYRMDLYVRIKKLSHYPFTNQIMINPDRKITGKARASHIYKKYEEIFLKNLSESTPSIIIIASRDVDPNLPSPSENAIEKLILENYRLIHRVEKNDFRNGSSIFEVYRQKVNT